MLLVMLLLRRRGDKVRRLIGKGGGGKDGCLRERKSNGWVNVFLFYITFFLQGNVVDEWV